MLAEKASGISNPPGTVDTDKGTSVDIGGIRLLQGGEADWGGGQSAAVVRGQEKGKALQTSL